MPSPALACILLAIDIAGTVEALAGWWSAHQPALRVLAPDELAEAVAAKDRRKAVLTAPPPGIPPPSMVLPDARRQPGPRWRLI